MLYSVLNSKQKQLHGHKSNKMRESTLSWIGNFEEKIDLSHIYLAVQNRKKLKSFSFNKAVTLLEFCTVLCYLRSCIVLAYALHWKLQAIHQLVQKVA